MRSRITRSKSPWRMRSSPSRPSSLDRDLVALGHEAALEEGGDAAIVLDDQNLHARCRSL